MRRSTIPGAGTRANRGQVGSCVGGGPAWLGRAGSVAFALALLAGALAAPVAGQDGRREIEEGNRLYEKGRFQEAHARYLEALEKVPGLAPARFNEGNALYRSQEFQRAMEAYLEALENGDPQWQSDAWYNLGNAMLRQQQPGPALDAYKQALRLDPTDQDAKHNLEMALRMLEQQEQGGEGEDGDEQNPNEQQQGDQSQDGQQGRGRSDPSEGGDEGEAGQQPQPRESQRDGESGQSNEEQGGEGRSGQSSPRMTPEQAERLLQAVTEDPGEVNRKTAQARGRRPRKDW